MAETRAADPAQLKSLVRQILDDNRTMTIATLRPDGWPQATIVGFVHDGLTLYFAVARSSQKLANIRRDPRTSIAIGHRDAPGMPIRGLSMAARVEEVTQFDEIERLNALIHEHYPEVAVFAPRHSNSAILRARPEVLSLIDEGHGLSQPLLLDTLDRIDPSSAGPSSQAGPEVAP